MLRKQVEPEPKIYFGKSAFQWLMIYYHCHNPSLTGLAQWCFPNGLPLFAQPNNIPEIFNIISSQIAVYRKQQAEIEKNKPKVGR